MNVEDRAPRGPVGQGERDMPVEAPGPQEGGVQHVGAVRGRQNDDGLLLVEPVHLGEDLVQRLLPLVIAAAKPGAATPADGIELVDEDHRRRRGTGGLEHLAHAPRAHAHEHLDEFRPGGREEGHVRLARQRPGQKRLARARRAHQQNPVRDLGADLLEAFGLAQEIHQFRHLLLGRVLARDMAECDTPVAPGGFRETPGKQPPKAASLQPAELTHAAPLKPEDRADDQEPWQEQAEKRDPLRLTPGDLDTLRLQKRQEFGIIEIWQGRAILPRRSGLVGRGHDDRVFLEDGAFDLTVTDHGLHGAVRGRLGDVTGQQEREEEKQNGCQDKPCEGAPGAVWSWIDRLAPLAGRRFSTVPGHAQSLPDLTPRVCPMLAESALMQVNRSCFRQDGRCSDEPAV